MRIVRERSQLTEVWGGIEAGGTHFVCAAGAGPYDLRAEISFPCYPAWADGWEEAERSRGS